MIIPVQLFAAEVYNCFASVSAVFSDHSINKVLCIDKTECSGHYTEYEITTTEGSTITVDTVRF